MGYAYTNSGPYTTGDELLFVARLKEDNPKAYEAYKTSFFHRKNWGNIDREQIAELLEIDLDQVEPNRKRVVRKSSSFLKQLLAKRSATI